MHRASKKNNRFSHFAATVNFTNLIPTANFNEWGHSLGEIDLQKLTGPEF